VVGLAVGVTASVIEVGAVEESPEVVVGLGDTVSVAVVVGAAVSVGLVVGETVVSEVVGAVEVSAAGAVTSVVVVVVSVAVSRTSLTIPPFQSVAISFAIVITQFPTTAEHGNNAGRRPLMLGKLP
jgi:hypothetical protein